MDADKIMVRLWRGVYIVGAAGFAVLAAIGDFNYVYAIFSLASVVMYVISVRTKPVAFHNGDVGLDVGLGVNPWYPSLEKSSGNMFSMKIVPLDDPHEADRLDGIARRFLKSA